MQSYADKIIRLASRLEMLERSLVGDTAKHIEALRKKLLRTVSGFDLDTRKDTNEAKKAVRELLKLDSLEMQKIWVEYGLTSAEASIVAEVAGVEALGVPVPPNPVDPEKSLARSMARVMPSAGQSVTMGQLFDRYSTNQVNSLTNIIETGYNEGRGIDGIVRKMINEQVDLQRRQAETLARTYVMNASNQARDDTAKKYGAEKAIWLATLDMKTCPYCQGQDGKCGDINQMASPPAHPRCRCVRVYVPAGTSCGEMKGDLSRVERGEDGKSKPTSKYENYGDWILTQPVSFQQEVLGIERSKMLRDGEITYSQMYGKTGKQKTIEDIKKQYDL